MSIKKVIRKLPGVKYIEKYIFCKKWKNINKQNFTCVGKYSFDTEKVHVGIGTYGELNILQFEKTCKEIRIGNYCSIAPEVVFLADGEHSYRTLSTYPFMSRFCNEYIETKSKGDIVVDDDVWIGYGVTVLSGVHIGQGAVIAAGAVVNKDIPPYAIVGGIPARIIKYRFNSDVIKQLLEVDYSALSQDMIIEHKEALYTEVENVEELKWLPKKQE